ncbi:chemotaxis protein [Bacillus safensis]|uniref:methyl-accepting chemotaxis protein n=1 Tax=Bacillus safensis TaxID=561879 RepID=UPI0018CCB049|nr:MULTISPECIES: methyl-accepting chemotaxis protein [Bacillus]MBG9825899.1 chemotaxis protein [Bacillus safensis]MBG9835546.1 chemotaxis protein [Bacillus safensis]MBG9861573.1 chemotaxis protein [Bacillus safensis]MBG9900486.1 chemotaxis protein [Bacillus safensis]WNF52168.1 methyl-accepting chemotaxis protein [Bacillus sp. SG20001]
MFKKLQVRIAVFISVILILTVVAVQVGSNLVLRPLIERDAKTTAAATAESMRDIITEKLDNYGNTINKLATSTMTEEFARKQTKQTLAFENDELKNMQEQDKLISFAYIGTSDGKMFGFPEFDLGEGYDPSKQGWFKQAAEKPDQVVWTDPYVDEATKKVIVSATKAIVKNGKVIGVAGLDLKLSSIQTYINEQEIPYKGTAFLVDGTGTLLAHPTEQGKNISKVPSVKKALDNSGVDDSKELTVLSKIKEADWTVGVSFEKSKLLWITEQMNQTSIIISVIAIILAIILSFLLARSITTPIKRLIEHVRKMSEGNLTSTLAVKSQDEIGFLTKSINQMTEDIRELIEKVKGASDQVVKSADEVTHISNETLLSSEQIATAIQEVATGATKQASDAETINEKSEYLYEKVRHMGELASQMQTNSKSSEDASYKGLDALGLLVQKSTQASEESKKVEQMLLDLEHKTKNIENVVTAISEISDQTNLLALNASIEAARAGESGRGFAVVAEEVRKLAEQSAQSTKHISETVKLIQDESKKAAEAMTTASKMNEEQGAAINATGEALSSITMEMQALVGSIDSIHTQINEMTEEQQKMSDSIQSIAAISEESAASAEEVHASTDEQVQVLERTKTSTEMLNESSQALRQAVDRFKV